MATQRQRKAAKIKLDNPGISGGDLVAQAGFSKAIQHTPSKVLESKGYKDALEEYGLTQELITTAKVDMHHPDHRKPLDVIFLCRKHHAEAHRRKMTFTNGRRNVMLKT